MSKSHILPTIIAAVIGLAGVLLVLFAWHLPPFSHSEPTTENAYIRGKVTTLSPKLTGYLSEVAVADFQTVKKGDLIARIEDNTYRQNLAKAEAALASTQAAMRVSEESILSAEAVGRSDQAALESAQSSLAIATSDAERSRALQQRGVTSKSDADQIELTLQKAHATLRQAEAQIDVQKEAIATAKLQISARQAEIDSAAAAVELAKIDLQNTEIRAPEDGKLGQVAARVGQYVSAGTALVSHVGKDVWVIANFKETELHGMREGQAVRLAVDALGGRVFSGKVASFSPATASEFSVLSGSNATGNFTKIAQRLPVRISIDPDQEMDQYLVPGLSVEVRVATGG